MWHWVIWENVDNVPAVKEKFSTVTYTMLLLWMGHVISDRDVQWAEKRQRGILGGSTSLGASWMAPRSLILGLNLLRHLWICLMEFCLSVPRAQHTAIVITGKHQGVTHLVLEAEKAYTLEATFKWQRAHSESRGEGDCQRRVDGKIAQGLWNRKGKICAWSTDSC